MTPPPPKYRDEVEDLAEEGEAVALYPVDDQATHRASPGLAQEPLLGSKGEPNRVTSPAFHPSGSAQRRRIGRSVVFAVTLCVSLGLVVTLATPLALLYHNGVFDDGLKQALLAGKTRPDRQAFPTNVGYAGPTPTGVEAALLATAPSLPMQTAQPPLAPPVATLSPTKGTKKGRPFNVLQHWGHLSPWYSTDHGLGGGDATSIAPAGCEIVGVHWLQRHGARYPTLSGEGPAALGERIAKAKAETEGGDLGAKGALSFLNDWTYKLGAEILTPFGRQQLFNLGVAARLKYGYLLDRFPEGKLPVFRTESQDRMLRSAQNFATGFFGYPAEEQYNFEVTIEAWGVNNTLAPYMTCPNDGGILSGSVKRRLHDWDAVFLKDALKRLQKDLDGYELALEDVKDFMETCAYETVALGYSAFCELFTADEWKGFQYRQDLMWWYSASFGSAIARAQGVGWMRELIARLEHKPVVDFDSTTNSSLHDDVHFPLNDPLTVDFTHDTVFAVLLPTLNLTNFAASGTLPTDHIPKRRSFISSKFCPFATNLQYQVLSCGSSASPSPRDGSLSSASHVRLILNDGVVPLSGVRGCPDDDKDGTCPIETYVAGLKELAGGIDFARDCQGDGIDFDRLTTNGSPVWD